MIENSTQAYALECYEKALTLFGARHFAGAQQVIRQYRQHVDYAAFKHIDNRGENPGHAAVIIITRDRGKELIDCLDSLKIKKGPPFETIVVDNGSNHPIRDVLLNERILIVECPIPFTPSEGRNIGAFHARADLLIFLDDDALAEPGFIKSAVLAFEEHPFLGIRGRILPKSPQTDHSLAGVYDLGNYPLPAILDIEGNMAVPKKMYHKVRGMNPLLFGAEGLEFMTRLLQAWPGGDVYYWPGMVIRHDYASGDNLLAKRKRQALANEYFRIMHPRVLKIKERYNRVYKLCRHEQQVPYLKVLPVKIRNVSKDMGLALKSEKMLHFPATHSTLDRTFSITTRNMAFRAPAQKEANDLLLRVQELEREIEAIRNSLGVRLTDLIREALSSPLRKGPILPLRLARLIKQYFTNLSHDGNGAVFQGAHIPGREIRNQVKNNRPGKIDYYYSLFDEFRGYRTIRNSTLRIACILSPWMYSCLDFEADLIPLSLEDWQEVLQKAKPDFLLVQSLLETSGTWQEYYSTPNAFPVELEKLVAFCKDEGIPAVFWDTEDHMQFPHFSKIAHLFDRIFASDPQSVESYGKLLNMEIVHLGPAVQPALHNPIKPENNTLEGFTILLDGWADILEDPAAFEFLKPLFKEGLHIIESRYRLMANKLDELPAFRENIMGCLPYGCLLSALRRYRVLIMPHQSLSSTMARSWQALEALACGCNVVMNGRQAGLIPEGLVIETNDDISLREKALELLKDDITCFRLSHMARRRIYASHTYAHRIRTICNSLKIEHDWEEFPLASVIIPTKRPELIPSCLDKFRNQNYPNKELIIAINTNAVDMEEVRGLVAEFPDIQVYQIHQEKNIGICLNFGVNLARGKYWFKMDDDDFYGTNYLQDMIHLCDTADFHIMGKPRGFIYLKDEDRVYLRGESIQSQHTIGSINAPHLTGATLGGIRDFFPGFSENHRACVDTRFVEGGRAKGLTIMCGDIWNFIAFRGGDQSKHTWRHDNENITKKAIFFYEGLRLDKIMI